MHLFREERRGKKREKRETGPKCNNKRWTNYSENENGFLYIHKLDRIVLPQGRAINI